MTPNWEEWWIHRRAVRPSSACFPQILQHCDNREHFKMCHSPTLCVFIQCLELSGSVLNVAGLKLVNAALVTLFL